MDKRKKMTPEDIAVALARYAAGEATPLICRDFGVTSGAINYHIRRAGVPVRNARPYRTVAPVQLTCAGCGSIFSAIACTVGRYGKIRRFCSPKCKGNVMRGPESCNWSAGKPRVSTYGYRMIRVPLPNGFTYWRQEHVVIAERALGRSLRRGEVVHHINGEKSDNRPQNLLVCTQRYHTELHHRMAMLYQREKFGTPARQEAA